MAIGKEMLESSNRLPAQCSIYLVVVHDFFPKNASKNVKRNRGSFFFCLSDDFYYTIRSTYYVDGTLIQTYRLTKFFMKIKMVPKSSSSFHPSIDRFLLLRSYIPLLLLCIFALRIFSMHFLRFMDWRYFYISLSLPWLIVLNKADSTFLSFLHIVHIKLFRYEYIYVFNFAFLLRCVLGRAPVRPSVRPQ